LMAERRRQEQTMSDVERARLVVALRKRKWAWAAIGRQVGLSANGAKYLWMRTTDPARYAVLMDDD